MPLAKRWARSTPALVWRYRSYAENWNEMSLKDNMEPRIEELLPFYVLDALTEEEKERVESYLAEHPEARAQVQELQSGASALPYTVTPVEPPRQVKDALM